MRASQDEAREPCSKWAAVAPPLIRPAPPATFSRFAREGRDASLIQERPLAIAVLAAKAKPPSAVASRALTAVFAAPARYSSLTAAQ
jgi:hypothetical protein